jgi:hypothetical protein
MGKAQKLPNGRRCAMPRRRRICFVGSRSFEVLLPTRDLPQSRSQQMAGSSCRLTMSALHIIRPQKCDLCRTVHLPDSIIYYLLLQKSKHFGQAQGPPFTESPFSTQIDWEASSCQAELILNGEYDSSELEDLSEPLINHCQDVIPLKKLLATIM